VATLYTIPTSPGAIDQLRDYGFPFFEVGPAAVENELLRADFGTRGYQAHLDAEVDGRQSTKSSCRAERAARRWEHDEMDSRRWTEVASTERSVVAFFETVEVGLSKCEFLNERVERRGAIFPNY